MNLTLTNIASAAAVAAVFTLVATAAPADVKHWQRSIDRHYQAAEENKYVPKGENPQWDFTLDTVVADMAWRHRTARMLRAATKPNSDALVHETEQLADRPEPQPFRFSF